MGAKRTLQVRACGTRSCRRIVLFVAALFGGLVGPLVACTPLEEGVRGSPSGGDGGQPQVAEPPPTVDPRIIGVYDGRGPFLDFEVLEDRTWSGFCIAGGSVDGCLTVRGNGVVRGRWKVAGGGVELDVDEDPRVPFGTQLEGAHIVPEGVGLLVVPIAADPFGLERRTEGQGSEDPGR